MAYSIEIKNEAKARLDKGEKAKEVSEQMGISLPTIYKWKKELSDRSSINNDKSKVDTITEEETEPNEVLKRSESEKVIQDDAEENQKKVFSQNEGSAIKTQEGEITFRERMKISSENMRVVTDQKPKKEPNRFNEILSYLTEKRRQIYVKAQSPNYEIQREGITQWDKMEILLEKVKENRNNKEYLNQLYEKISQLKAKEKGMSR